MAEKSQLQKAGSQSHQIQVSGDYVVNLGISEERASAIAEQQARAVLAEYSSEAATTGGARIAHFSDKLVEELSAKCLLEAFKDPSFQVLLRKAQLGAASTDQESDHDLLTKLLSERATKSDRAIKASIDRAVQIVDLMDEEALRGLTVMLAITRLTPTSGSVAGGLDVIEGVFGQLVDGPLPTGDSWVDHLDILDAVRIDTDAKFKKFTELYSLLLTGYVAPGIPPEALGEITNQFTQMGTALPIVEHELKAGSYRFSFPNVTRLQAALSDLRSIDPPKADQLVRLACDKGGLDKVDPDCQSQFDLALSARPSIRTVKDWWDKLPGYFQITGVGRAIARANSRRLDKAKLFPVGFLVDLPDSDPQP